MGNELGALRTGDSKALQDLSELAANYLQSLGLTGAKANTRYVGGTATGAPATGTFQVGDFVVTQDGNIFVCTTAGPPGTWTNVSASGVSFAAPSLTLSTTNAAGVATTAMRTDATVAAFDATVPVTQSFGDAAAAGSAGVAARRDHKHGMPAASSSSGLFLPAGGKSIANAGAVGPINDGTIVIVKDLLPGGTASASATFSGSAASAIDGDDTTQWYGNGANPWLQVDTGAAGITGIAYRVRINFTLLAQFTTSIVTVQSSPDAVTWTSQGSFQGDGTNNEFWAPFSGSVTARYWRIIQLTTSHDFPVQTFSIFNSNMVAFPTTPGPILGSSRASSVNVPAWQSGLNGTTTNDNAAAGFVGEFVQGQLASGSATSLVTATSKTVTSVSLTAGDWDVEGVVNVVMGAATVTNFKAGTNTATNTLGAQDTFVSDASNFITDSDTQSLIAPRTRYSLASTTTVYLVAQATFSAGTCTAYGTINARRVR